MRVISEGGRPDTDFLPDLFFLPFKEVPTQVAAKNMLTNGCVYRLDVSIIYPRAALTTDAAFPPGKTN